MLLETALADFSTDESEVFEDAQSVVGLEWETMPSASNSPLKGSGGSNSGAAAAAGPAEIKHVYLDVTLPSSRQSSGDLSTTPHQTKPLLDFLGMSRSPPAVDACGPSFEISRADDNPTGKGPHPGRPKSPSRRGKNINAGAGESTSQERMPFTGDTERVPSQPGKPRLQRKGSGGSTITHQAKPLQLPPTTSTTSSFRNGKGVSPSSGSFRRREELEQGRVSSSPKPRGVSPIRQSSKVVLPSGDTKQMKRPVSFKMPPVVHSRLENHHNRGDAELMDSSMNSEYKYYEEESPVSILERPRSPPTTNSSGSSGSSVHSPPRTASASTPVPPLHPGVTLSRHRLPSFSSSSAQDSPRASTSSSNRYMGQCLVALQAALAIDPEKSKRFEDSFLELDTYIEGEVSPNFPKSPIDDFDDDDLLPRNQLRDSPVWARGRARSRGGGTPLAPSQLDPEYNTMDFYTDSEDEVDDKRSHVTPPSATSSLARSSSGGSSMSRPIRRSLNYNPQVSVDEYSLKDKRFLSSHPSSWVEQGDDSASSSLTNSKCNTLTRHQEVPWDEQQADLETVRAEEVVRGAIDGLRFTYSPVSSAFVFTRSANEGDEEAASARRPGHVSYRSPHHKTFTDSEVSRRFSVDYETSICSEDSMSFARGSDVTELGVSRAESWSKVARGIAFQQVQQQQGYQDAVPSSFGRRAGNAPPFEGGSSSRGRIDQTRGFNPGGGAADHGTPDSRLVRKRPAKKSAMTTCLPFRSILRNFRTVSSPGRSRLGMTPNNGDRQLQWTSSGPAPATVSRLTY